MATGPYLPFPVADGSDVPWWVALVTGPVLAGVITFVWKAWDKVAARRDEKRTHRIQDEAANSSRLEKLLERVDQDRKDAIREREEVRKQAEQDREDLEQEQAEMERHLRSEIDQLRAELEQCKMRQARMDSWMEYVTDLMTDHKVKFRPWVEPPAASARHPKPDTQEAPAPGPAEKPQ